MVFDMFDREEYYNVYYLASAKKCLKCKGENEFLIFDDDKTVVAICKTCKHSEILPIKLPKDRIDYEVIKGRLTSRRCKRVTALLLL